MIHGQAPMQSYYINLGSRTDRRAAMEQQFATLGLAATRIEATTPAGLSEQMLERYGNPRRFHWLTPAELACSDSHRLALEALIESGAPRAAIFEDDVVLSTALKPFLAAFDAAPPPFDLVRLETYDEPLRLSPGQDGIIDGIALRRAYSWAAGAAGYIVSRRAAEIIVRSKAFRQTQVDRALFNPYEPLARRISMRHADPGLCIQEDRLPGFVPNGAGSSLAADRQSRGAIERRLFWRRFGFSIRHWCGRELRIGPQKLWHETLGGAKKQRIPFKAN